MMNGDQVFHCDVRAHFDSSNKRKIQRDEFAGVFFLYLISRLFLTLKLSYDMVSLYI